MEPEPPVCHAASVSMCMSLCQPRNHCPRRLLVAPRAWVEHD